MQRTDNAVDLFPLFYEAIDNRAFTYMELGKVAEALQDFETSLEVNPDGEAAFFSRGECLMKLGQLLAAEAVFQEGQTKFLKIAHYLPSFLSRFAPCGKMANFAIDAARVTQ